MSLNTNPTGSPFDKTILMMKIETLEQEVFMYRASLKESAEALKQLASLMGIYSSALQESMSLNDQDWANFVECLKRYSITFDHDFGSSLRLALHDFIRIKLGSAHVEIINQGLSGDGSASQVP